MVLPVEGPLGVGDEAIEQVGSSKKGIWCGRACSPGPLVAGTSGGDALTAALQITSTAALSFGPRIDAEDRSVVAACF
jgi:hypothetical protein